MQWRQQSWPLTSPRPHPPPPPHSLPLPDQRLWLLILPLLSSAPCCHSLHRLLATRTSYGLRLTAFEWVGTLTSTPPTPLHHHLSPPPPSSSGWCKSKQAPSCDDRLNWWASTVVMLLHLRGSEMWHKRYHFEWPSKWVNEWALMWLERSRIVILFQSGVLKEDNCLISCLETLRMVEGDWFLSETFSCAKNAVFAQNVEFFCVWSVPHFAKSILWVFFHLPLAKGTYSLWRL